MMSESREAVNKRPGGGFGNEGETPALPAAVLTLGGLRVPSAHCASFVPSSSRQVKSAATAYEVAQLNIRGDVALSVRKSDR